MTKWLMHLLKDFSAILTENAPLAPLTTFRIGGPARYLFRAQSEAQLGEILVRLEDNGIGFRVLGGGSNILVDDAGYPGAVIRLDGGLAGIDFNGARATVGAGALLARLVAECARRGLAGVECLAGIPGTAGGALVMNAGGRHGYVGPLVRSVSVFDGARLREVAGADAAFSYRSSSFAGKVVGSAELELRPFPAQAVAASTREIMLEKRRLQPLSAASAGCVFRNPPNGPPAGALIDRAGLKGAWVGGARVSQMHANYIVNAGGATAADVKRLIEKVRAAVSAKFGVELELEIDLW